MFQVSRPSWPCLEETTGATGVESPGDSEKREVHVLAPGFPSLRLFAPSFRIRDKFVQLIPGPEHVSGSDPFGDTSDSVRNQVTVKLPGNVSSRPPYVIPSLRSSALIGP